MNYVTTKTIIMPKELLEIPQEAKEYYAREIEKEMAKEFEKVLFGTNPATTESTITVEEIERQFNEFKGINPSMFNEEVQDVLKRYATVAVGIPSKFLFNNVTA